MLLTHLSLCLFVTVLTACNVAAYLQRYDECYNDDPVIFVDHVIYRCNSNNPHTVAGILGCYVGFGNLSATSIGLNKYYNDTDYVFYCKRHSAYNVTWDRTSCIFHEHCPNNPVILAGGETQVIGHQKTAFCEILENGTITKSYYTCDNMQVNSGTWSILANEGDNDTKVAGITCNAGLYSYYTRAYCTDGEFVPSSVTCGNYQNPAAANVFRWHGQFFKPYGNPSRNYNGAATLCKNQGGTMATALSTDAFKKIQHILPFRRYIMVGLRQKASQPGRDVGWYWIDTTNGSKIAEIDQGMTPKLAWTGFEPNDVAAYRAGGAEANRENYGTIARSNTGGQVYINDSPYNHPSNTWVLCQFDYPFYEFVQEQSGHRMTFPLESKMNGASFEDCSTSCASDSFCRSFSYSSASSKCDFHSMPPDDPEAVVVSDAGYDIYA